MRVFLSAIFTVALCLLSVALVAQEPFLEITMSDSLTVPYSYDYVIQLPNSDLQFYKLNYATTSIQFFGFRYLSQTNEFTTQEDIVTITNLDGLYPMRRYMIERFGNFYLIHKLESGLAVFKLDQNTCQSRIINEYSFDQYFDLKRLTDIVTENVIAIALADSLVYYNFIDGSSQTLLQGAEYQCAAEQIPTVIALPDDYFMYIKDAVAQGLEEIWVIFDSDGHYLFSQTSLDPDLQMSVIGGTPKLIHGRWYIPAGTLVYTDGWLECHFSEPDSLHYYFFDSPWSTEEHGADFFSFGNNMMLRLYYNDFYESGFMFCNNVPLEQFPDVIFTYNCGNFYPRLTAISADITTITTRMPNQIAIHALWTYDFPTVHEFYFPASYTAPLICNVFTDNNFLRIITNQKVYSFHVEISTSIADETNEQFGQVIQVYPNPAKVKDVITFKASIKQYMELDIYNIRGQRVDTVTLNSDGTAQWDFRKHKSKALCPGLYFAKPRNLTDIKPVRFIAIY